MNENINKIISDNDDSIAAHYVSSFFLEMKEIPAVTKMKVCFNLTCGIVRLFCVGAEKEQVEGLAKMFYEGIMEEIESSY